MNGWAVRPAPCGWPSLSSAVAVDWLRATVLLTIRTSEESSIASPPPTSVATLLTTRLLRSSTRNVSALSTLDAAAVVVGEVLLDQVALDDDWAGAVAVRPADAELAADQDAAALVERRSCT